MNYSQPYHRAVAYLVNHGGHGPRPDECRMDLARALRHIRHAHGNDRARSERRHLLFIAGHFPAR